VAILKDGKVLFMLERYQIEGRSPEEIAAALTRAFDQFCSRPGPSIPPEKYQQLVHAKMCGSRIPRLGE